MALISVSAMGAAQEPELTHPTEGWEPMGTGVYFEDLVTYFGAFPRDMSWEVEVEQNTVEPGWYRFAPYAEKGEVVDLLGPEPDTYIYLNATNPNRVWMEHFRAINGGYVISNLVYEDGWAMEFYGTLKDGFISFPLNAFAIFDSDHWEYTGVNTGLQLYLPGTEAKYYGLSLSAPYCTAADNSVPVSVTCGKDLAYFKAMVTTGYSVNSPENAGIVDLYGTRYEGVDKISASLGTRSPGICTLLANGYNDKDEIVAYSQVYCFSSYNDPQQWKYVGEGQMQEGIFSAYFPDIEPMTLTCAVEQNTSTPGLYRLVNPYENHPVLASVEGHDHDHYIYLDVSNPDRVYIPGGPVGVNTELYGEATIYSKGAMYVGTPEEENAIEQGLFGWFNRQSREVTFPDTNIMIAMPDYGYSTFYATGQNLSFTLPDPSAVEEIDAEAAQTPTEYFDLYGRRIESPAKGQIVVVRKGQKASLEVSPAK